MIRTTMLAAAALLFATPATAQSIPQSELDDRYDRALAAGYKALFLCGALANTEIGLGRSDEDILASELSGIQPPLDMIAAELEHTIYRFERDGDPLSHVAVAWAEDMPPRIAFHMEEGGCSLLPIGATTFPDRSSVSFSDAAIVWTQRELADPDLGPVFERAFSDHYGADARTTAVLVRGHAEHDDERYAAPYSPYSPQRTWSVAKSIAATIVGAAVQRGDIDVNESAGLGADETDPRRAITIDHALRMASGRYSDTPGNRTDPLYYGGATVDEVALDWPLLFAPGTMYRYANNDTLAAVQAIEHTFADHPPADLFETLDMGRTIAETDWQGNYILSSQVWATARDLANLGQLHLQDGMWRGERILPEGWVDYITTPSGPQPSNTAWGYGAGWWLANGNLQGVPADMFAARGNRGQYLVVIPSENLIIVRRGEDPAGGSGFDIVAFTADVLSALNNEGG
ncbi:serine hydrolase domain-containing protein [Aurantiacibacter gangjinensis]|uniref:Beta-lactamase n=1 Tax=Aurantiacibacter gangjinensis TaxID=502682 RepID=A0A0G9MWB5_9SPHN|nr:serine hydrolase [Aurantiacibacter gangjinensis]KLE33568.1 beta-lactamase [Aurantiacibacter gangjinensis]